MISEVKFEAMKRKRLREKLAFSEAQAERGEFAEDGSLDGLLAELDREREPAV